MSTRRVFLRNSALAVVGTATIPSFLTRAAFGATDAGTRNKRLVVIFQRGAADGLSERARRAVVQGTGPADRVLDKWITLQGSPETLEVSHVRTRRCSD